MRQPRRRVSSILFLPQHTLSGPSAIVPPTHLMIVELQAGPCQRDGSRGGARHRREGGDDQENHPGAQAPACSTCGSRCWSYRFT